MNKTIKTRIKTNTNITNESGETIGILPQGIVADISLKNNRIYKPLKGSINSNDFEPLYNNTYNVKFYTLVNTLYNIYPNPSHLSSDRSFLPNFDT